MATPTSEARAALALIRSETDALFAQLDEHISRMDGNSTFRAMANRHGRIEQCIRAYAKQSAEVVHELMALGTDTMDDRREDFAKCFIGVRNRLYAGVFDEVEADAEAEAEEMKAARHERHEEFA